MQYLNFSIGNDSLGFPFEFPGMFTGVFFDPLKDVSFATTHFSGLKSYRSKHIFKLKEFCLKNCLKVVFLHGFWRIASLGWIDLVLSYIWYCIKENRKEFCLKSSQEKQYVKNYAKNAFSADFQTELYRPL